MQDEKITVIVPVYKVEKYLKRCVDSILHQTYQNLEVILVDDGSPDACGELCDNYAATDSRIKVLHQENGGQSKARNEAMKVVTGKYFCFVDSDDYMHEEQIDRLYQLMLDYKAQISMVNFCNFTGECVSKHNFEKQSDEICELSGVECIKNMHMVQDELYVVMWGKLFQRELFDGIYFPEGRICEDLAILYRLFDKCQKVVYSKEMMYYYFRDNESSSTFQIKDKFYTDVYQALEDEIVYMKEKHPELADYPRKTYMYWLLDYYRKLRGSKSASKEMLKELHQKYRQLYREGKSLKKEKFYTAFYYAPELYLKLKE